MNRFIFERYEFETTTNTAHFYYAFEDGRAFHESVSFDAEAEYNLELLERALFLAFILVGVSYYKLFPSAEVVLPCDLDHWQVRFFNHVYQEGLSQFAYENELTRHDLAHFVFSLDAPAPSPVPYAGSGRLVLQSGGKDSLLVASILHEKDTPYIAWYLGSTPKYPALLEQLGVSLKSSVRSIDIAGLKAGIHDGGKDGHVPITYIVQSFALIQAILLGKNEVIVSIAHEGEEPHHHIDDLAVTHQWSKTWSAEQDFSHYVSTYISPDLRVGSPLRSLSEMRVAELFVEHAWEAFGHSFSSCNVANYQQGNDNTTLKWCGNCPKCANSYLLFAPFLPASELQSIFGGQDLFSKSTLSRTFMGLLDINNVPKPFECIGEIDELRLAYDKSQQRGGYDALPFDVPASHFDSARTYDAQAWATEMLQ